MANAPFIKCSGISRSLRFYTNNLEFVILRAPDPGPAFFMSRMLARGNNRYRQWAMISTANPSGSMGQSRSRMALWSPV